MHKKLVQHKHNRQIGITNHDNEFEQFNMPHYTTCGYNYCDHLSCSFFYPSKTYAPAYLELFIFIYQRLMRQHI